MEQTQDTEFKPSFGFRVLQVSVFVMGALLIIGFVALIGFAIARSGARQAAFEAPAPETVSAPSIAGLPFTPFDTGVLDLPDGARLLSFSIDGRVLAARIRDLEDRELIVLFDIETRQQVGRLAVQ